MFITCAVVNVLKNGDVPGQKFNSNEMRRPPLTCSVLLLAWKWSTSGITQTQNLILMLESFVLFEVMIDEF